MERDRERWSGRWWRVRLGWAGVRRTGPAERAEGRGAGLPVAPKAWRWTGPPAPVRVRERERLRISGRDRREWAHSEETVRAASPDLEDPEVLEVQVGRAEH